MTSATSRDTIAAVSSPPGRSPRGLIRISGDVAIEILGDLIADEVVHASLSPRHLQRVNLQLLNHSLPALVSIFRAPASYTGRDLIELQVPGHPALLERLIRAILRRGARLAEPGEFTFLAYLAGKIDLTEAEGIGATIAAVSDAQLAAAAHLRSGELGDWCESLVGELATQLALVEAGIDFVDQEDVVPIGRDDLLGNLKMLHDRIESLRANSRSWGALDALPRVVLMGAPSSGKSTLFNALLGKDRAVIAHTPGTTRDVLSEAIQLTDRTGSRFEAMLVDIAGLDSPQGTLDRHMQRAARNAIETADLILRIDDGSPGFSSISNPIHPSATTIKVRTKIDLIDHAAAIDSMKSSKGPAIAVSAVTDEGIDGLKQLIAHALAGRGVSIRAEQLALQPRHEQAIQQAGEALGEAIEMLTRQAGDNAIEHVELVAGLLRDALDGLACLGGEMTPDDVIGRVFATFCVGK